MTAEWTPQDEAALADARAGVHGWLKHRLAIVTGEAKPDGAKPDALPEFHKSDNLGMRKPVPKCPPLQVTRRVNAPGAGRPTVRITAEEIIQRTYAGETRAKMAKAEGCSVSAINHVLERAGVRPGCMRCHGPKIKNGARYCAECVRALDLERRKAWYRRQP